MIPWLGQECGCDSCVRASRQGPIPLIHSILARIAWPLSKCRTSARKPTCLGAAPVCRCAESWPYSDCNWHMSGAGAGIKDRQVNSLFLHSPLHRSFYIPLVSAVPPSSSAAPNRLCRFHPPRSPRGDPPRLPEDRPKCMSASKRQGRAQRRPRSCVTRGSACVS